MKKVLNELINTKKNIECKINILQTELNKFEQMIAEMVCPFKVGDRLINRAGEIFVLQIIYADCGDDYGMKGRKLKKEGVLGKVLRELYNFDGWKKVK